VAEQPNEPYEERVLAMAYRALLRREGFDAVFNELAGAARRLTNCDEVVISSIDPVGADEASAGPWTSGSPADSPGLRSSLPMPVVTEGRATHLMTFYKSDSQGRFAPTDVDHARRCSELAGLLVAGAGLLKGFQGLAGIDDETGVLLRRGFEADLMETLSANDGRAGLFIVRVADLEQINIRWGREVGDEVLRLVARAMRDAIGSAGTVGRLRRHEFAGLLPGLDLPSTREFATATERALANPLPVLGRPDVQASIVMGMAAAQSGHAHSVTPLLHATYQALETAAARRDPRASAFGP
jgi:diguanylate cyclase (GGDEF)-like protein